MDGRPFCAYLVVPANGNGLTFKGSFRTGGRAPQPFLLHKYDNFSAA